MDLRVSAYITCTVQYLLLNLRANFRFNKLLSLKTDIFFFFPERFHKCLGLADLLECAERHSIPWWPRAEAAASQLLLYVTKMAPSFLYMFHLHVIKYLLFDKQFNANQCFNVVTEVQCCSFCSSLL